jgi:hypothetical protein
MLGKKEELAAIRGVGIAVLLGTALWAIVIGLVVTAWRAVV